MVTDDELFATLRESQRLGFLGERQIEQVVAHARVFVRGLDLAEGDEARIVDLGAGGGVPGLVIAAELASVQLTMVDRRSKRTDFLERVVRRHGWSDRVTVISGDAHRLATRQAGQFDAAVARGFGPPGETVELATRFVRHGGRIVVSEPPIGDRWDPAVLDRLGLVREDIDDPAGRVVVFRT